MSSETGESTASINARRDDDAMQDVISALRDGGRLRYIPKLQRAVVEIQAAKRFDQDPRAGRTITMTRTRQLLADGIIQESGVDTYTIKATEIGL